MTLLPEIRAQLLDAAFGSAEPRKGATRRRPRSGSLVIASSIVISVVVAAVFLGLPGVGLLLGGSALYLWSRGAADSRVAPKPRVQAAVGTDTARLLDNFEQRFAELKGRKASASVLGGRPRSAM